MAVGKSQNQFIQRQTKQLIFLQNAFSNTHTSSWSTRLDLDASSRYGQAFLTLLLFPFLFTPSRFFSLHLIDNFVTAIRSTIHNAISRSSCFCSLYLNSYKFELGYAICLLITFQTCSVQSCLRWKCLVHWLQVEGREVMEEYLNPFWFLICLFGLMEEQVCFCLVLSPGKNFNFLLLLCCCHFDSFWYFFVYCMLELA